MVTFFFYYNVHHHFPIVNCTAETKQAFNTASFFVSARDCCITTEHWLFILAHRARAIRETEAVYISETLTLVIADLMKCGSRYALRHILHSLLESEGLYSVRQTSECPKLMALSTYCKQNCNPHRKYT